MRSDRRPPKGMKAFAVKISMDLIIVAKDKAEISEEVVFDIAKQQYEAVGPELADEFVQIKRVLSEDDIPEGWEDGLPWCDGDVDLEAKYYIPTALELLAEQAE